MATFEDINAVPIPGEGGKALEQKSFFDNLPIWDTNHRESPDGPVIIKYSFGALEPFRPDGEAAGHESSVQLSPEQRACAREHMLHLSRIADIKFVEVPPEEANVRFFQTRYVNEEYWKESDAKGMPGGHMSNIGTRENPKVDVMLSSREFGSDPTLFDAGRRGSGTLLHELMHALGADHPRGDGNTPGFANVSVQSYLNKSHSLRLGDAEWLVSTFGESKRPDAVKYGIQPGNNREDSVVIGKDSVIDLRGLPENDLPITVDTARRGYTAGEIQISEDATIHSVIAQAGRALTFIGDGRPETTIVKGSAKADEFRLFGGGDDLTGGGGKDSFWFNDRSGMNHIIRDFTIASAAPTEKEADILEFGTNIRRLSFSFNTQSDGKKTLEVEGYHAASETPITSVKLENVELKQYRDLELLAYNRGVKIEGKTPADALLIEELRAGYITEKYGVKTEVRTGKNGDAFITLPLEGGRDPVLAAQQLNLAIPGTTEPRLKGDALPGFTTATVTDPATGEDRTVLVTTNSRFEYASKEATLAAAYERRGMRSQEERQKAPAIGDRAETIIESAFAASGVVQEKPATPEPEAMKLKPAATPSPKPNSRDSQPER